MAGVAPSDWPASGCGGTSECCGDVNKVKDVLSGGLVDALDVDCSRSEVGGTKSSGGGVSAGVLGATTSGVERGCIFS